MGTKPPSHEQLDKSATKVLGQIDDAATTAEEGSRQTLQEVRADICREQMRVSEFQDLWGDFKKNNMVTQLTTPGSELHTSFLNCIGAQWMDQSLFENLMHYALPKVLSFNPANLFQLVKLAPDAEGHLNFSMILAKTPGNIAEKALFVLQRDYIHKWFDVLRTCKSMAAITDVVDASMWAPDLFKTLHL